MSYSHWIVDTQTGVRLRLVRPASGTWSRGLNASQTGTHTFRLSNKLSWQQWNDLFDGWRRMLVVCWNDVPVYAGFIVKTTYDYAKDELAVDHASFRAVLARRFLFGIGGYAIGTLQIVNQSLPGIIFQLLIRGTQGAPSVVWPLRLVIEAGGEAGGENRTYFNYAYQSIEAAITEITNTENGPDVDFAPRWDGAGALEHVLRVGRPWLMGPAFEFNASSAKSSILLRSMVTDFSQMVTGVFALGKGSGEIKKHGEAATVAAPGGYISLDVTRSFTQLDDVGELNKHAAAEVATYRNPIRQWSGDVLASRWLPTAQPGSTVSIFRKANNWRPAEFINLRAVGYSGDVANKLISLKVAA